MFNRKNAIIGFLVLKLAKRSARRSLPGIRSKQERPWLRWVLFGFVGMLIGALAGGLFWRRRRSTDIDLVEFEVTDVEFEEVLPPDVPLPEESAEDESAAETADTSAE